MKKYCKNHSHCGTVRRWRQSPAAPAVAYRESITHENTNIFSIPRGEGGVKAAIEKVDLPTYLQPSVTNISCLRNQHVLTRRLAWKWWGEAIQPPQEVRAWKKLAKHTSADFSLIFLSSSPTRVECECARSAQTKLCYQIKFLFLWVLTY